jgi:hypothetical protein
MQSLFGAIVNTNKKEIMVSVDAVYQKVLAIANKEQRGYITPQEFNLFADHAQKDIFRQYFYDLEQRQRGIGNSLSYADTQSGIEEKIALFEKYDQIRNPTSSYGDVELGLDVYKLGMVRVDYESEGGFKKAERIELNKLDAGNSPLTRWNKSRPAYTMIASGGVAANRIKVYPYPTTSQRVLISYIRKLVSPNWTYVIVGESAMFDDLVPGFQNFELHDSEETLLVIKILQLAGINMKDPTLVQLASQEEVKKIQQEKQ